MLNNRDDDNKFDGNEDSEYHFTDEDVSYESEPESTPQKSTQKEVKENLLTRLTSSKRMLGAVGLLLVLVFVVYKLASPTVPSSPSVDIVSTPPKVQTEKTLAQAQTNTQQVQQVTMPTSAPIQPARQIPVSQQAPLAPPNLPPPGATIQNESAQAQTPPSQVVVMQGAYPQQAEANASIPTVIPVQSAVPTSAPMMTTVPATTVPSSTNYQVPGMADANARASSMANDQDRLLIHLQTEYTQKLNEFTTQNKALQDQLQTLNSRVAGLESKLAQLLQALSRQTQQNQTMHRTTHAAQPVQAESRIPYNVQAIIPGRAWLKSDNGETVTVAEGDLIKGLGRITKIDPYDGIVEINTGNKLVSLSYGNGA